MLERLRSSLIGDTVSYMNKDYRSAVAAEVRAEMGRAGIRQADLAALIGIAPQTLSKKLNCHVAFTAEEIVQIALALNIQPSQLLPRQVAA